MSTTLFSGAPQCAKYDRVPGIVVDSGWLPVVYEYAALSGVLHGAKNRVFVRRCENFGCVRHDGTGLGKRYGG